MMFKQVKAGDLLSFYLPPHPEQLFLVLDDAEVHESSIQGSAYKGPFARYRLLRLVDSKVLKEEKPAEIEPTPGLWTLLRGGEVVP